MSETEEDLLAAESGGRAAADLIRLMQRLRRDCPWDRKQGWSDLAGYLLEECYEALDALAARDLPELEGELGDLLLQIVFLTQLGREAGAFDLASVARRLEAKMVARHPHVFGEASASSADAVKQQWEKLKQEERAKAGISRSPFEGLPRALPALLKAVRITSRAADLGFDWKREEDVLAKLDEELAEFRAEVLQAAREGARERVAAELGDILFTIANVARRHGIDPEAALQTTNAKFARRFEEVARRVAAEGREMKGVPLEELDALWEEVKRGEVDSS
jgi:nucleoside triphosphate diphosphatase